MLLFDGGLIAIVGILVGRFLPGRRRTPRPAPAPKPVCGCGHGLHDHDPETRTCNARLKSYKYDGVVEDEVLDKYVPCTCKQYTGPEYVPNYIAREIGV